MKKKSFLQNIFDFVSGNIFPENSDISPKEAQNIQLRYQRQMETSLQQKDYPPYLDIAKQLFSEKSAVVRAAGYYLAEIAIREAKFCEDILGVFRQCIEQNSYSDEDLQYLKEQINRIEKGCLHIL